MNILVINPCNRPFSSNSILIEPIDALNIASFIESKGHSVDFLDMDVKRLSPADIGLYSAKKYQHVLLVYDYHIPLHTDQSLADVMDITRVLKQNGCMVSICGKIATFKPEIMLNKKSSIDYAIRHDAEEAFMDIVDGKDKSNIDGISWFNGNTIQTNKKRQLFDIEQMPLTNYSLVNLSDYIDVRTILSSRGCINKCSFCQVPAFWQRWRGLNPDKVVNQIETLVTKYGTEKIMFLDDNAMVSRSRMSQICNNMIKRDIKCTYGCLGSIEFFDNKLMQKMYIAGFRWIHYGAESGSQRLLDKSGKKQTPEQIKQVIKQSQDIGFRVRTSWIIDLPNAFPSEINQTLDLIQDTQSDEIRIHYLALRLGTKIQQENKPSDYSQYIHQTKPQNNLTQIDASQVESRVNNLLFNLQNIGYTVIRNQNEMNKAQGADKVVSMCPLRYGMGWSR